MASYVKRFPLVVILGATGAGKSKLALELAMKFNGEIISTDAMQTYKGLDIVTNKVTTEERKLVPHHMIDFIDPLKSNYNVIDFKNDALLKIDEILEKHKLPVLVGGTSYYTEALLWNTLIDAPPKSNITTEDVDSDLKSQDNQEVECNIRTASPTQMETLNELSTQELHDKLKHIDLSSANVIHPGNRRKILRAIEVYFQYGTTRSEILDMQHSEEGATCFTGALRYPEPCIIWVQCQQDVLDDRVNRRVDKMIDEGLVTELEDFHHCYNKQRMSEEGSADYYHGIFQSIGFKEFHQYLLLCPEQKLSKEGKVLFQSGVEEMKRVTRQYSRKQWKRIVRRFLCRKNTNVPPVYSVDSSEVEKWQSQVYEPAYKILQAYLHNEAPSQQPIPLEEDDNVQELNICYDCDGLVFTHTKPWKDHVKGRRHKKQVAYKRRKEKEIDKTYQHKTDVCLNQTNTCTSNVAEKLSQ